MTSFDSRPPSFSGAAQPSFNSQHAPYANMSANHAHQNNIAGQTNSFRSFSNANGQQGSSQLSSSHPQIYTAVYSGVAVYEMEVQGVAVMRRRSDSWLNATQILKVAGVDKGKRTKILEKEILTGQHEKIQGGYGKYQGTWINYERGREFCHQYGVEDILRPLLEYDVASDGSGVPGHIDTPTKEQAMAANRKRFYNSGIENHRANGQMTGAGTFFQNYSPTVSNALAAVNKAAKYESPMARPGSAQRRPSNVVRRPSQQQLNSQETVFPNGSQQSVHSFLSDQGLDGPTDVFGFSNGKQMDRGQDSMEPPRKRLRPSSQDNLSSLDPALQDGTPTEPADSFCSQYHYPRDSDQGPLSYPPLQSPTDKAGEEKRLALLDLFSDATRTDFSSHTAILHLSNQDLDIPLDASANTALHWAATLARVSLMKLLISKGANMFRGNAAGQTPLMAAVQVNNSLDHSCFPAILEVLGPLIEIRDATGRTILHHIAVSSGIKGRGPSSRYYLESLLEYTVRNGSNSNFASQTNSFDGMNGVTYQNKSKSLNLVRFMSEVVNVQDKTGNTALNLVARIGNRTIINQLEEVGADFTIPNHGGFRPTDFGVFPRGQSQAIQQENINTAPAANQTKAPSQIDQIKEEIFATTTSILSQTQSQYSAELTKKQGLLDQQNAEIRDIAAQHRQELDNFEDLQKSIKDRSKLKQRITNMRHVTQEQETRIRAKGLSQSRPSLLKIDLTHLPSSSPSSGVSGHGYSSSLTSIQSSYLSSLPSADVLRAQLAIYSQHNASLKSQIGTLRSRSADLESQYRRVVSLCTGVEERRVDEMLESLVAAVESEDAGASGTGIEVGRVREFLRKVDGAGVGVGMASRS